MKWQNRRQSTNIDDRRGAPMARGGMALGGMGLVVVIVLYFMGVDVQPLLNQVDTTGGSSGYTAGTESGEAPQYSEHEQELQKFVSVVLADTEVVWHDIFSQMGDNYEEPTLVLFTGQVDSACGSASSAVGPFYCPGDDNVYLDLSFLDELRTRFGAGGDFAGAYVIAHEIGHHVQNQLGTSGRVNSMRERLSETEFNKISVMQELQADFYAGVWAHYAENELGILDEGDIEEALTAANAIGDDTLQRQSQGTVVPDSFTHGTSEQRMRWFRLGYQTGDMAQGDTFSARDL